MKYLVVATIANITNIITMKCLGEINNGTIYRFGIVLEGVLGGSGGD